MAKDSTAVQRLIELAQQKPIDVDLGGLFDGEPPRRAAPPLPRAGAMQPAGAPPPLPRRPSGTQNLTTIPAGTPAPERVDDLAAAPRVTNSSGADLAAAEEMWGNKPLPPLPQARRAAPPPAAALPPPRRSMQQAAAAPPAPVAKAPVAPAPLPRPPAIADELPTSPVSLNEMEGVDERDWFQQSEAVPMLDEFGTQSVLKSRGSAVVAIAAAFGLGLIVAGGYIVYSRLSTPAPKPVPAQSAASRINAASAGKVAPAPASAPAPAPSVAAAAPVQAAPAPAPAAVAPAPAQVAPAPAPEQTAPPPTVTPIEPASAQAAAAAPAAAAPVAGTLVDVTLKSDPSGVTVMLIDGGGAVKLGKTPTVASLSAGTQHQILFTREGYSATMATIDPAAQTDVMVALAPTPGSNAPAAVAVVQPAPAATAPVATPIETAPAPATKAKHVAAAPAPKQKHVAAEPAPAPKAKHVAAEPAPAPVEHVAHAQVSDDGDNPVTSHKAAPKRAATATATSGTGTLMIGAKPPCDIIIDGRATGLTTPQRAINLPPGSHNITLVNRANDIKKSFSVSINAGAPTKVVKDFTSLMRK
jgi:hypothetical protein